jgi:uncharacterized protein (TIGR00369 family)
MDDVRAWVEASPFGRSLGVRLGSTTDERVVVELPFAERNANPGDALHGGCAASLGVIGAQVLARSALGTAAGPFQTAACQVSYLAAAIAEPVVATSSLLRRGKELVFSDTLVATEQGKPIAQVSCLVRSGAPDGDRVDALGDDGRADPGEMGPFIGMLPFAAARQLDVQHMAGSRSRIVMPLGDANADLDGGMHEGALLALLDTTGAMASWAATGPGRFKASTAALQAQVTAPPPAATLVGYGRVVQRSGDLFWSDVEIAEAATDRLCARGTVVYRIVTGPAGSGASRPHER